jgi:hypothetical protein
VFVVSWVKRNQSRAPELRHYLSKHLFDALLPLTVVSWMFAGIAMYHRTFRFSSTRLSDLVAVEERLSLVADFVKALSIPLPVAIPLIVATLLVQFKLATLQRDAAIEQAMFDATSRVNKYVRNYGKWIGIVAAALAFASSFTLFDRELGPASSELRLRIKTLRDGYADFSREAKEAAAATALTDALDEALTTSPANYPIAIPRAVRNAERLVRLARAARAASFQHGIRLEPVQALEQAARPSEGSRLAASASKSDDTAREAPRKAVSTAAMRPDEPHPAAPSELSEALLESANNQLRDQLADLEKRIGAAPWRTQLSAFNSKVFGAALKVQNFQAFAAVAQEFPVLQPLLQVAENVAKDIAVHRVDQRINALLARAAAGDYGTGVRGRLVQILLDRVPSEHRRVDAADAEARAAETLRLETELQASEDLLAKRVALAEHQLRTANAKRRGALMARWKAIVAGTPSNSLARPPSGFEWHTDGAPTRADHERAFQAVLASADTATVTEQRDLLEKVQSSIEGSGTLQEKERALAEVVQSRESELPELARVLPKRIPPPEPPVLVPHLTSAAGFGRPSSHSYPSYNTHRTYEPTRTVRRYRVIRR